MTPCVMTSDIYDKKVFEQQNYQEDVKFPNLLLSNNLPFVYGYEKCVRHNSLFNCDFQTDIKKLIFKIFFPKLITSLRVSTSNLLLSFLLNIFILLL